MRAIVTTKYGPPSVLQLKEVVKPVPKDNEVLIKIHAATVTAGDCEMRAFNMPFFLRIPLRLYMGIRKPRINILGQELSGKIEAVGKNVKQFKEGDSVFAPTDMKFGAYSEYICLPEKHPIAIKPEGIGFDVAATIPTGGLNGLHFHRKAKIQAGESVLINGAGGSIGTYGLMLAKMYGALVTAVDSGEKLEMLTTIGADHVMDYQKEDYTRNGEKYDVIIDVAGKSPFWRSVWSLKKNGRFIIANPALSRMIGGLWVNLTSRKKVINALTSYNIENMDFMKDLVAEGKINPVIDRQYPLERLAEAHQYVDGKHKKGNVIITL